MRHLVSDLDAEKKHGENEQVVDDADASYDDVYDFEDEVADVRQLSADVGRLG